MQVISVNSKTSLCEITNSPIVMVLGNFDGVHLGHQYLLNEAYKYALANNYKLATMIFSPHPLEVLRPRQKNFLLNDEREKFLLLESCHLDYLFIVNFTEEFANIEPSQFVEKYLIALKVKKVFVGFDYTYGKNGTGNATMLRKAGQDYFQVTIVRAVEDDNEKISSTKIRSLIEHGDFLAANKLLGYNYVICGEVVYGKQLGRKLGYPTANIKVTTNKVIPALGVYAVKVKVKDNWYLGMCNVGYNPTVATISEKKVMIEVHILNFAANIYGETICLSWLKFMRKEKKFASIEKLTEQLATDRKNIQDFFVKQRC